MFFLVERLISYMDAILIISSLGCAFPVASSVLCPEEIKNGRVEDSCSRINMANCVYECEDNCDKDADVNSLICRNGTWYSARTWTMDTESPCKCDPEDTLSTAIFDAALSFQVFLICICVAIIKYKTSKRKNMARSRSTTACRRTEPTAPPIVVTSTSSRRTEPVATSIAVSSTASRRTEPTAPPIAVNSTTCRRTEPTAPPMTITSTASRRTEPTAPPMTVTRTESTAPSIEVTTNSTQRARVQNRGSFPINMLSNTAIHQSVQYMASQSSCYSVPGTSSNGSAYPDAPPLYNTIDFAAVETEMFPPPPSYEEAVSQTTSPTTRTRENP